MSTAISQIAQQNKDGHTVVVKVNSPRHTLPYAYLLDTGVNVSNSEVVRYHALFSSCPLLTPYAMKEESLSFANLYSDEIEYIYEPVDFAYVQELVKLTTH